MARRSFSYPNRTSTKTRSKILIVRAAGLAAARTTLFARGADPLASWNDTAPKETTVAFVERVTKEGSRILLGLGDGSRPLITTACFGPSNEHIFSFCSRWIASSMKGD